MTNESAIPQTQPYRSFVYRQLQAAGANFIQCRQGAIAADFGAAEAEKALIRRLGLIDLTPLPRLGFKGAGIPEWLQGRGVGLPQTPNSALIDKSYGLVARLGHSEILMIASRPAHGDSYESLALAWNDGDVEKPAQGNILLRAHSHACFALSGEYADKVFAKLCAVDLCPTSFMNGSVALTSVARVAAIIIRSDCNTILSFRLLVDGSYAEYLWDCLTDAMTEYDGGLVGAGALSRVVDQ